MTLGQPQIKPDTSMKLTGLQGNTISYKKNSLIYRQKETAESFYLVIDGCVELLYQMDSDHSFSKKIKTGEFFGIDEIFDPSRRLSNATALEDCQILKIEMPQNSVRPYSSSIKNEAYTQFAGNLSKIGRSTFSVKDCIREIDEFGTKIINFSYPRGSLNNALLFKNYLFDLIDRGNTNLIINLSMCKTIDSTFLGTLIASLKKISALNGKMSLVCKEEICSWLFVMTKMEKVFEIFESLEEALNSSKSK